MPDFTRPNTIQSVHSALGLTSIVKGLKISMTKPHGGDNSIFERLLENLKSPNVFVRIDTTKALGGLGDTRAVDPLIAALSDPEWRVCQATIQALSMLGDIRAIEPMLGSLTRDDIHHDLVRSIAIAESVAKALGKLGEPGFQALLRMTREFYDDEPCGQSAAYVLGEIADPRALNTLLFAMQSPVYEVAQMAAEALNKLGDVAISPLVKTLGSPNSSLRDHACRILRRKGPSAIPVLLEAFPNAKQAYMRADIIEVLGSCEDKRVLELLRAALNDPDEDVREAAAFALAEEGDASGIELLLEIPPRDHHPNYAAEALANLGELAFEPLVLALADMQRQPHVRVNAATALGQSGDLRAVKPLLTALRDESTEVCSAAAEALGKLKARSAVEPLLEALESDSASLRSAVISALGSIEDPRTFDVLARIATDTNESTALRTSAAWTITLHFKDHALPVLRKLLFETPSPRPDAVLMALCELGPDAVPVLLEAAHDSRPHMRESAETWLEHYLWRERDPRILEFLAQILTTDDQRLRLRAALILGRLGDARTIEPLLGALRGNNILLWTQIAHVLAKIGDERAVPVLEEALTVSLNSEAIYQHFGRWIPSAKDALQDAILSIRARQRSGATASSESESG